MRKKILKFNIVKNNLFYSMILYKLLQKNIKLNKIIIFSNLSRFKINFFFNKKRYSINL
jgi:hypothetical protein